MLAVAAVVVLAVSVAIWFAINRGAQVADIRAELDLRPYALMRSAPADNTPSPLDLQRARLTLTMILPVGFEPGMYEVQILDSDLMSRASAPGMASSENFVTTLRTVLDLSSLSTGTYQLALRRAGQEWQLFPAIVR